jgi:HSP20 family protein
MSKIKTTTDVFVVADGFTITNSGGLLTGTSGNISAFTGTNYTQTLGTNFDASFGTVATGLGYSPLTGTGNTTVIPNHITFPTYNDFWKFDEEFDILWKSFFENNASFRPIKEKAVSHPCDIQETDNGLRIEIAAVGLDKEDIDIIVDSETLRIAYRKTEDDKKSEKNEYRYLHRSIKKASFDIAWKISSKYNMKDLSAELDKGLLTLDIPFAKENKPTRVKIK